MIKYKQVDRTYFEAYDSIPMNVVVKSKYLINKVNGGLNGIFLQETPVDEYTRDLSVYEKACNYEQSFDISNWGVFMAFDGDKPIAGVTVVSKTKGLRMLDNRDDLSVLWDIRVDDNYKGRRIGQNLFKMAVEWSKERGFKQMKIETQNTNVGACKFYQKQRASIGMIDEYGYLDDEDSKDEVMIIWYLDLS